MIKPTTHKLASLLNVEPGEGRMVLLLVMQYVLFGATSIFTQTAAFSLFLTQFDSQWLAYTYLVNAAVVILITFVYLRLASRVPFTRLLVFSQAFQLVVTIAYRAGLAFGEARWVVFLLPTLFQIQLNMGNVAFWSLAARLFDVRQGKRLFGVVGAGQWISIVVIGFVMTPLVGLVGTSNLLVLASISLACALGLMAYITRRYAARLAPPAEPAAGSRAARSSRPAAQAKLGTLLRSRYVLLIFSLILLWWMVFFFLDNLFYRQGALQYPEATQLASFLGGFLALLGILTLFSNFFISGPLVSRLGLRTSLLILPIALLAGTALTAVIGSLSAGAVALLFWLMVLNKLLDMSAGLSFDKSAQTILYQPLPAGQRAQVQAAGDGIVQPAALGLAGAALIALNALFPASTLPLIYALVALAAGWTVVVIFLGRAYPGMLVRALARRSLGEGLVTGAAAQPDASSTAILKQGLGSPHPGVVIYSLNMLETLDAAAMQACLPGLLSHPDATVRGEALRRIEQARLAMALPNLRARLDSEPSPEVRGAIIHTALALGDEQVFTRALACLDDPDVHTRHAAIVGLLKHGGIEGVLAAGQTLLELGRSPHAANRVLAAQVLGEAGIRQYDQPLAALLRDTAPAVRRAALRSAGQVKSPRLWPMVIDNLCDPRMRMAAAAALVAGGDDVLPEVERALSDGMDAHQTALLATVCGRIGGDTATGVLEARLDHPDVGVRDAVLRALSRCAYSAQGGQAARVKTQLFAEAGQAAWVTAAMIDLAGGVTGGSTGDTKPDPADATLLRDALCMELARSRERVFFLLSFLYDAPAVLRARDNLLRASADKQAYALEVLDVLVEQDLKPHCFPLFEDLTPEQRMQRWSQIHPVPHLGRAQRLSDLAGAAGRLSPWTATCARYALHQLSTKGEPVRSEEAMLTTIEKVIILKTVSIFAATPDEVLADVALACEEVEALAGENIFEKGDAGDSLYIVASGRVRVHDGDRTIDTLADGDVFGEMAVLDPEARSASVTALEDTHLLRLDEAALDELMEDRPEVSRGIIRVLSRRLRDRMRELRATTERQPDGQVTVAS